MFLKSCRWKMRCCWSGNDKQRRVAQAAVCQHTQQLCPASSTTLVVQNAKTAPTNPRIHDRRRREDGLFVCVCIVCVCGWVWVCVCVFGVLPSLAGQVGFGQGNFNSDNCLVAGRTMDYGPFGFMERYDPDWVMWTGGGRHFGFRNQPEAGAKNFESLARAIAELFDPQGEAEVQRLINETYPTLSLDAQNDVWRRKLGLSQWTPDTQQLHFALEGLMQRMRPDWTLFWRQLAASADIVVASGEATPATGAELFAPLEMAFSPEFLPEGNRKLFLSWLEAWQGVFVSQEQTDVPAPDRIVLMRKTSPKYVPREWMLVDAYQDAHMGQLDKLHELEKVFAHPYDEQPEFQERFYKRPPEEALTRGGTAFMT
eukprot:m.65518 g.65518  ORF g.65518 m.65518 type:complete len:370 (+) comp13670_c0_seq3:229-1338(+)